MSDVLFNICYGHFLVLAAVLCLVGMAGVLIRRNALVVFMCIELMLNAANLTFLAFARERGDMTGHISAFFITQARFGPGRSRRSERLRPGHIPRPTPSRCCTPA